jgi:hypothetical protein
MKRAMLLLTLTTLLVLVSVALAESVVYDLSWYSVDGGGVMWSAGGGFTLGGTIGQADAGVLAGGAFTLSGGFWGPGGMYYGFLPVVMR